MACKKCGSEQYIKNGVIRGKQRYRCNSCGLNFVLGDQREKVSPEGKALAILLYGKGKASYEFIARLFKVSPVSVMKWVKDEANRSSHQQTLPSIREVSFDEMWHFVNRKKNKYGHGGQWSAFEIAPSAGVTGLILLRHFEDFYKPL